MRNNNSGRSHFHRAVFVIASLAALLASAGCDVQDVYSYFAGSTTINLILPLGLDGSRGIFNPSGSTSSSTSSTSSSSTSGSASGTTSGSTTPPVGAIVSPTTPPTV